MEGEFQDWELLHSSDSDSVDNPRSLDEIEDESGGMIRPDYFSLDGSAIWIDPGSETRYQRKDPGGFWSDSGSDLSDERKLGDFDPKGELLVTAEKEVAGGLGGKSEELAFGLGEFDLGDLGVKGEYGSSGGAEKQVDVGEIQGLGEDSPKFWSASGGKRLAALKLGEDMSGEVVLGVRNDQAAEAEGGNGAVEDEGLAIKAAKPEGDEDKRTVWWKVPFELLSCCFYGMCHPGEEAVQDEAEERTLQLKITVDDKVTVLFFFLASIELSSSLSLFCLLILHTMFVELKRLDSKCYILDGAAVFTVSQYSPIIIQLAKCLD
ncbi:uncharacterized protein [Rutidosis leptorrhynchoides]|uniref:uncharacterized protein n=1 Tax=Rutidosis leptorrhynchoides TaxID=125765 RepID=UPI003A9930E2